jgi:LemA protein
MNSSKIVRLAGGGFLLLLLIATVVSYNRLVSLEEKMKQQWSEVNNAYQRRTDLLPNLVNVVKGQADFEKSTLEKMVEARTRAASVNLSAGEPTPENIRNSSAAQNELAVSANRLIATIERYPELKGTEAFRGLQTQLEGTERRIKYARKDFNEAVAAYNSRLRSFPVNIVGKLFGFTSKEGFQADTGADRAVEIQF